MFGRDKGFKGPNLAWTAPGFQVIKGIIHAPCAKPALRPESRDALLTAIAKARGWINDIRLGRIPARAGVARVFWSAERRGAGAIVGYGRGVPADRDGFALWRQINPDKTGCTSRFLSVRRYSRWMPSCVAVIYSVGGCPGRCDRLPHWELSCLRFRWVTFNRGRRLMHEAFWLPGH